VTQKPEILLPWKAVDSGSGEQKTLAAELGRELPVGHLLQGHKLTVVARRLDRDDILVSVETLEKSFAMPHLTWRNTQELDPRLPRTQFFSSWEDWTEREMMPAHILHASLTEKAKS